jgi:hypothetical protein
MFSLPQITHPNPTGWPREELEETVRRWLEANQRSEGSKDWAHLAPLYTDDAVYLWTVGPGEEFVARGKKQIEEWAVGEQMAGFEGWKYPYQQVLIDEKQGQVVGFWKQVSPFTRPDGSTIEVAGIGGSWFKYGGNYKWCWQRDFFDLMSVFAAFSEISAQGNLSDPLKKKLYTVARGRPLAGHERLRPKPGVGDRLKQGAAMAKVVLFGK